MVETPTHVRVSKCHHGGRGPWANWVIVGRGSSALGLSVTVSGGMTIACSPAGRCRLTGALLTTPGHAELSQSWPICKGDDLDAGPEQRIENCTAIIESPHETRDRRAGAYFHRALAWRVVGNLQRAITDLTEAIALNPRYDSLRPAR